ncbi:preprotein translocase subunit SecG [Brucella sp. 6810]|uniref:preprotein translocase subunit SecG n=1 Tax=Brucella sp. 6810 TaxID=2769351 RepID=UPI00165B165C|nr:preprotein translocase subunit SecG [Brucella sp. 6810]QNQ62668.1 preprotein translocase subunit SecG [Brucella sp. 6810]
MQTVLIVIHLLIVLALVGVVLIQRSEGGGLGIGGGSGFMTARGAANALTRTTAILAIGFFATSLLLGIMARYGERPTDILNRIPATTGSQSAPAGSSTNGGGILDQLGGEPSGSSNGAAPAAPGAPAPAQPDAAQPQAPAAPANPVPSSQ